MQPDACRQKPGAEHPLLAALFLGFTIIVNCSHDFSDNMLLSLLLNGYKWLLLFHSSDIFWLSYGIKVQNTIVETTRAPHVPTRSDLCFCKVLGMEFTSVNMARQNPLQIGRFNGKKNLYVGWNWLNSIKLNGIIFFQQAMFDHQRVCKAGMIENWNPPWEAMPRSRSESWAIGTLKS